MPAITATKHRISKKFLAQFPQAIQARIQSYPQVQSATYDVVAAGSKGAMLYADEGSRFHVFYGEPLQEKSVEMASEMTFGAANVSYDVTGQYPLPAGATAIEVFWCGGKRMMRIINVAQAAIEAVAV